MKIQFGLAWHRPGQPARKAFKSPQACALLLEYTERISRFCPCGIQSFDAASYQKGSGAKLWVCHRGTGSGMMSSEELAAALAKICDGGCRELWIAVGGPDGFSEGELAALKPDMKWSFGPLTLPHELAAIVAGEQIYRAWTILKILPYHQKH
ncbi:MAG: 23S rRNA (pseudouridine(1915)-N(3))-methyltransferase RlmH [Candidatus Omnitrophica bacterium]|nr:23S rRNA (pseudouridine(1915)-N(3))-methyltransferase RlmH [Candidatus Omnitrophota bacterium]